MTATGAPHGAAHSRTEILAVVERSTLEQIQDLAQAALDFASSVEDEINNVLSVGGRLRDGHRERAARGAVGRGGSAAMKRAFKIDESGPDKSFHQATWTFTCAILLNRQPTPLRARFRNDAWAALRGDEVLVEVSSKEKLRKWLVEHADDLDLSPIPEPELTAATEPRPARTPVKLPRAQQLEMF